MKDKTINVPPCTDLHNTSNEGILSKKTYVNPIQPLDLTNSCQKILGAERLLKILKGTLSKIHRVGAAGRTASCLQ